MATNTTNKAARRYVQSLTPFKAHNLYGEQRGRFYVVFSYGEHFPLFVNDGQRWFENEDKYSTSTSKQKSQSHPLTETSPRTTQELKRMINS